MLAVDRGDLAASTARVAAVPVIIVICRSMSTMSGTHRTDGGNRLETVGAFADQAVVPITQCGPQPGPDDVVVVDDQHPDHRCSVLAMAPFTASVRLPRPAFRLLGRDQLRPTGSGRFRGERHGVAARLSGRVRR